MLIFSCHKEKKDLTLFYNHNKDNSDLLLFDAVHIAPARGMYVIKLFKYDGAVFRIDSFDEYSEPKLVVNNSAESFRQLNDEYNIDYKTTIQYLTNLFSIFNKLDVLAVFGMPDCNYIKFIVDYYNVVVYVPNRDRLSESVLKEINELEKKADRKFDEHWFTYKLDKPFSFSG